jgi:hypothetical protein
MLNLIHGPGGTINLQATLASSSAGDAVSPRPHHPITCVGDLRLDGDGSFACEHTSMSPGDTRTQYCINHSVALLLIELALDL